MGRQILLFIIVAMIVWASKRQAAVQCIIVCTLLLMGFTVSAQTQRTASSKGDTTAAHLPVTVFKDRLKIAADSVQTGLKQEGEVIRKSVKNTSNIFTAFFRSKKDRKSDTLPTGKTMLSANVRSAVYALLPDSANRNPGHAAKQWIQSEKTAFVNNPKTIKHNLTGILTGRPSNIATDSLHLLQLPPAAPLLQWGGGYADYHYNFRSATDTPFAEQNIGQHLVSGNISVTVAGILPVTAQFWIRRSNSTIYHNITDVQLSFDPAGFRNRLVNNMQQQLLAATSVSKDSLLEKLTAQKLLDLTNARNWLSDPMNRQRLREYRELVQMDVLHAEERPGDSAINTQRTAWLKQAKEFLQLYDATRLKHDTLSGLVDTLQHQIAWQKKRLARLRQTAGGQFGNWSDYASWKKELADYDTGANRLTKKYQWLMGIRNFSLGKSPLQYSELTAKNIRLSGINFEYNSWYYLAVAAGLVDYRFRDVVVTRKEKPVQYMYLLRAGLGRLERNYFIVSFFNGRKQLYAAASGNSTPTTIPVSGITAETKWQLSQNMYVVAEAGESVSPDYRSTPPRESEKFNLRGNTNKALSVKWYSFFPKLGARIEGMYKYTGANYQSFSTYQTSAAVRSWNLKWEQVFFNRRLKITGALRSNEFTNPYIVQHYKSNTVFKSINAVLRMRKWPSVSVGYTPMSQLSAVGTQLIENRFQTLTASINHFYRIGQHQAFTMLVYNKFYNTRSDSGFIYFNAANMYLTQHIVFRLFSAGITLSDSKGSEYRLTAAELQLRIPLLQQTALGMGIKINNLNRQETKTGGRFYLETGISKKDKISIAYEKYYLPGTGRQLINSDIGSIQYSRHF